MAKKAKATKTASSTAQSRKLPARAAKAAKKSVKCKTKVAKKPAKKVKKAAKPKSPAKPTKKSKPVKTVKKAAKAIKKAAKPAPKAKTVAKAEPPKAASKPAFKPTSKPVGPVSANPTTVNKPQTTSGAPAAHRAHGAHMVPTFPKPPPGKPVDFKAGDFVVYPTHGVGKVTDIETRTISGHELKLFVIEFDRDRMTLRVPVTKAHTSGLRKLSPDV